MHLSEAQREDILNKWIESAYWLQNELLGDSTDEYTDSDLVNNNYYLRIKL